MKLPTVFFTPGAWHVPAAFDNVRSSVAAHGFTTDSGTLASVGSTNASVGVADDAAGIRADLLKHIDAGEEVVLVAHSYGGVVSSNAVSGLSVQQRSAAGQPGGILMLIYMAAFAIPSGVSLVDGLNGIPAPWWGLDNSTGLMTPVDPVQVFYADVKPCEAAKLVKELGTETFQAFKDKSGYEPWNEGFNVGYIFTEQDQAIALDVQQSMFSSFPAGSFSRSLNSSHSPFVSMPDAVADIVADAVAQALANGTTAARM